ncbi:MAG: DNA polymerase III subunit beta [Spirochaetae bacterium HGW-Spirochaetae-7]|jgi:DNA polymerase-3 subunit beta|nr:MAG: DNA polymerase III subunit beta [Spirochaetae bacterium HGW-Spirochaetae-7]
MKFVCEKNALQREITFAQEIISSRSSMSVVSNVYLEASDGSLLVRATDIKIGFETRMPVDIQEPGSFTVFCDKLNGILSSIPEGTIEVDQKDLKVVIKPSFKKAQFSLKTIASEQFPQLPDIDDDKFFSIPVSDFRDMIGQTVFAVSDDETRYFMNGVFLERVQDGLVMVATDGRRLAYIKRGIVEGIPDFKGVIIPPKLLSVILHRASDEGQIELAVNDKNLFVKFGQYRLSTVLIEGQFPTYQKVIPESQQYLVSAKRQDILDALKRVSIFVEQKSRRTFFALSADKLVISSEESDIGTAREEIPCTYDGPEAVIAMNYKYIDEPLRAIESEGIRMRFTETSRAVTLSPDPESDYFHILMPMQVD